MIAAEMADEVGDTLQLSEPEDRDEGEEPHMSASGRPFGDDPAVHPATLPEGLQRIQARRSPQRRAHAASQPRSPMGVAAARSALAMG